MRNIAAPAERNSSAPKLAGYRPVANLRAARRGFFRRGEQTARAHGLIPHDHLLRLVISGAADGRRRATVHKLVPRRALSQSTGRQLIDRAAEAAGEDEGRIIFWAGTQPRELYEVEQLARKAGRYADLSPEMCSTLYGDKDDGR